MGDVQYGRCDHSEGEGFPISVPVETLVEVLLPGGCRRAADFPSPPSVVGGDASSHPGQGSCCSCPAHSCSDEGGGPGSQLDCQLAAVSDWMSQRWSWAAEWVPIYPLECDEEECRSLEKD